MPPWCSSVSDRARRRAVSVRARFAGVLFVLGLAGCGRGDAPGAAPTRAEVWAEIQPLAARYRIEPEFIYALVAAESNFDPRARNDEARGLLQLKPAAWRTVSRDPYEPQVWDWRMNLRVGVEYLAWCRHTLHRRNRFSYPALLASFHYGLEAVERRGFDPAAFPVPENAVYRELWRGNLRPVAPPR